MKSKNIIAYILIIVVFTVTTSICYLDVPVMALDLGGISYDALKAITEIIGADESVTPEIVREAIYDCLYRDVGFIPKQISIAQAEWLRKALANKLNELYGHEACDKDNLTEGHYNKIAEYLVNNITINENDNSVTYNDNSREFLLSIVNEFLEENRYYYVYSNDIQYMEITSEGKRTLQQLVTSYQDNYDCFIGYESSNFHFWAVPKDAVSYIYTGTAYSGLTVVAKAYNSQTYHWNATKIEGLIKYTVSGSGTATQVDVPSYSNSNSDHSVGTNNFMVEKKAYRDDEYKASSTRAGIANTWRNGTFVTMDRYEEKLVFGSYLMMQEYNRGNLPYYVNKTVYNNFTNSTGDYTVTYDNSNKATYNDVTNYIDNRHTETNNYPESPDIDDWIIRYNPSNPVINDPTEPNNPGSGSGGGASATANATNGDVNVTVNNNHYFNFGGSVSDNSVSDNDLGFGGSVWDFSWISSIGQTLGNLISNLGSAISNLIRGIAEVLEGLVETIPTVFGDFIGMLLGWLPPELRALVTLGFVAMIMFGLVKVIRG